MELGGGLTAGRNRKEAPSNLRARGCIGGFKRQGRRARPYRCSFARQVREEDRGAQTRVVTPEGRTQQSARAASFLLLSEGSFAGARR
jgi:hypothetical protein